jgi:hypothetical protein
MRCEGFVKQGMEGFDDQMDTEDHFGEYTAVFDPDLASEIGPLE